MFDLFLSSPWVTYHKMVKALFERDPDITVCDIYEPDDVDADYAFNIEVANHDKSVALDKVMPRIRQYGNVIMRVVVQDTTVNTTVDPAELFETVFKGNNIVKDIKVVKDQAQCDHYFLRFYPEVIQFFNDDLTDYSGNWSGLAEELAYTVFENAYGMNFCTASIKEDG